MACSIEDACNKKISYRHRDHDDALMPSSKNMTDSKHDVIGVKNEERSTESPPTIPTIDCSPKSCSPNNVMDAEGKSFCAPHLGQNRSAKNNEPNGRGDGTTFFSVNISESVSLDDSSGGKNEMSTNNLIPRSRTRVAAKPARFRQPAEEETSTTKATEHKKKEPKTNNQKKDIAVTTSSSTKDGRTMPLPPKKSRAAGAWTDKEQQQFEAGCLKFGWGNWCYIENCIPTRTRNQVKSHAQKFQKHHPEKKKRLEMAYVQLGNGKTIAKNNALGAKKRKIYDADSSTSLETMSESKKRSKPSELAVPKKPAETSKRAPPTKEKDTPPICKGDSLGVSAIAVPSETKGSKPEKTPVLESDAPRKRSQFVGRARQDDRPGTGPWTSEEHEQFKDGCILYGWGDWRGIASCISTRTNAQVKSHAQKFQKHHPEEKEKMQMEHTWRSELIKKNTLANKEMVQVKKETAERRSPLTKNKTSPTWGKDTRSGGSWSFTEQKQFEDGCILEGWGNWSSVASHIPTRSCPQVRSHAQKYRMNSAEQRERLVSEHKRHYLQSGEETSAKKPSVEAEHTKVRHILLNMAGISRKKDNLHSMSTPGSKCKTIEPMNHVISPPPGPTYKTTVDDYGAAEAILALNFARWDGGQNRRESASSSSEDIGLKESSRPSSSKMNADGGDVCIDSQKNEDEFMVRSEIDLEETSSAASSKTEEFMLKIAEDAHARVDRHKVDDKSLEADKSVATESKNEDKLGPKDSHLASRNVILKGREDSSLPLKCGPIRQSNTNSSLQPPPHWLAVDTWSECLGKIQLWNNQLSGEEQNLEYRKYDNLTDSEKELLRQKLLILMKNRPTTRTASV
mmetsp:Transcript_5613/g.12174  ORF Transcript_5613/g.12174 Transcript_5613/m.12174 type:complete len:851 (+) Transcript_5613:304-2856(+)